ncbi:MAG: biotin--protein ligase [Stenotrophomonas sp.]
MHGEYKVPGGKLVVVDLQVMQGRLQQVQVSGDFFIEPDSALALIDRALEGLPTAAGHAAFSAAVSAALPTDVQLYGISADGVAVAVQRALDSGEHA